MKIQDLKEHLDKYGDALVLVGPGAIKSITTIPTKEDQIKFFNNKMLRRSPDDFWNFYFNNFYIKDPKPSRTQFVLNELYSKRYISNIVSLYPDGILNALVNPQSIIELHGNMHLFSCQNTNCKTIFTSDYVVNEDNYITECEVCGKKLRPNILLSGEAYDNENYQSMIALLNKTHTLFTIGLDYTESPILDLIADFCELKKSSSEDKILVSVLDKDIDIDLNEQIGFHEFIVKDNCDDAMERLLEVLK